MIVFHLGAIAALFFFTWKALFVTAVLVVVDGRARRRNGLSPSADPSRLQDAQMGGIYPGGLRERSRSKAAPSSGWPHTAFITSTRIKKATRTHLWTANGGRTWAGSWSASPCITTPLRWHTMSRTLPKTSFTSGSPSITGFPMIGLGAILLAFGGISCFLWGIFLRTVLVLHSTWLVNSATHTWGSRRFTTRDLSTNNFWVALLTWGEGWHNNHHAHPVSARHGLKWYEIDLNWYGILDSQEARPRQERLSREA